jgi:hypothetical protein
MADGAGLLQVIASQLDPAEFESLKHEAGFLPPNDFDFEWMRKPLARLQFPRTDQYEYLWAIYECGLKCLSAYSPSMRQYVAAIYLSCNKAHIWGATVQGDYCYTLVEATLSNFKTAPDVLSFLLHLSSDKDADDGYDPRFAGFSCAALQSALGRPDPLAWERLSALLVSNRNANFLADLRVCEYGIEDWRRLYARACSIGGQSDAGFEDLFLGRR